MTASGRPRLRLGPLLAGTFLILIYIQLGAVQPFRSTAGRAFVFISSDELRFWLAHWVIAVPGLILMGVGLVEHLGPPVRRIATRLQEMSTRNWGVLALGYFALLALLATVGRAVFLLDLPITDDESLVVFGARMILEGDWTVPILQPDGAFTQAFTYRHDGMVSALEYPGSLLFRALSLATGLDALLYALIAAAGGIAVAATAGRLWGRAGALIAAGLWLFSPMALTLGMTTHSHLVSRSLLAIALWLYVRLMTGSSSPGRDGALLAVAGGFAFLTRSLEASCVLLPVMIHLLAAARRDGRYRRAVLAATGVSLAVLAFYAWYNLQTTGIFYQQARFGDGVHEVTSNYKGSVVERLGYNLGHNSLLLVMLALGPFGALAAVMGFKGRPVLLAVTGGLGLQIALTLLYHDTGIHTVGPIHFSETLPAIVLLATAGALRAWQALEQWRLPRLLPASAALVYVVGGLGIFSVVHSFGLRTQAENSAAIYDTVAHEGIHNAVVIGDRPIVLIRLHPIFRDTGSWVHWFPAPDPYFRDDVIYAHSNVDLQALRARFPERSFYRMTYHQDDPPVRLTPLE